MEPRLIVFLPERSEQPVRWLATDVNGSTEGEGRLDEGLPEWAVERPATGIADGSAVMTTRVAIPARSRERLRRALPFALEDRLSEDVGSLHFAPGQKDKQGRVAVAVVARACMDDWIERLREAGIELEAVYPEPMMLPLTPGRWSLLLDADGFVLRMTREQGFAGEIGNLADLLSVALAQAGDDAPEGLTVYYQPGTEVPELPPEALPASWQPIIGRRALIAEAVGTHTDLPLLVGPYQRRTNPWLPAAKRWGVVAGLALVALLMATTRAWLENHRLGDRIVEQERQLQASFQEVFPNRDIATGQLRQVMAARLERLRAAGDGSSSNFLALLEAISPSLDETANIQATGLSFRRGDLELEVTAGSLQEVDKLKQALANRRIKRAAVRSTTSEGEQVRARLTIEPEGS